MSFFSKNKSVCIAGLYSRLFKEWVQEPVNNKKNLYWKEHAAD